MQRNSPPRLTLLVILLFTNFALASDPISDLMNADHDVRQYAAKQILQSKDLRYVPSLAEVAFFWTIKRNRESVDEISDVLQKLTGEKEQEKYFEWLQWIGKHPEIKPLPNYVALKRSVFQTIDPALASIS